jgi:hypothetical protein
LIAVGLAIEPFRIDVDDGVLADLRERLHRARFPEQISDAEWDYGTEREYLKQLVAYWAEGYEWRAREARMNGFDQFRTEIDGTGVHFLHLRSAVEGALPLVLTHGWPGSIVEFFDVIAPLTDPAAHGADAADAFHVVVPALPGYGFSGPTRERGWHPARVARAWKGLMAGLGYDRYVAILNEMVHDVRLIPLDARPRLPAQIRQWMGDSRGRWEGDTLVVETTNFMDLGTAHPAPNTERLEATGGHLHLVERFTRLDADTLLYQFTINDPTAWTKPWSVEMTMTKTGEKLYEYACHEGNYGLFNILAGARADERAADAGKTDSR